MSLTGICMATGWRLLMPKCLQDWRIWRSCKCRFLLVVMFIILEDRSHPSCVTILCCGL